VKQIPSKKKSPSITPGPLKGWTAIARYLGIPVAPAHRWASEGMPVRREGRFTVADREAVSAWLGRESHMPKPAHVRPQTQIWLRRSKSRLRQCGNGGKTHNGDTENIWPKRVGAHTKSQWENATL
jgi:hypothetical protein